MNDSRELTIHAVPHPNAQIHRVGLPIDHRYVEQCWAPVIGPTCVLLLRRVSDLWEVSDPAAISLQDLGRVSGLGNGSGAQSPVQHSLDRLERFGFLRQGHGGVIAVNATVAPLSPRQLDRLPQWSRGRHEIVWGRHLAELAAGPQLPEPARHPIAPLEPPAPVRSTPAVPVR